MVLLVLGLLLFPLKYPPRHTHPNHFISIHKYKTRSTQLSFFLLSSISRTLESSETTGQAVVCVRACAHVCLCIGMVCYWQDRILYHKLKHFNAILQTTRTPFPSILMLILMCREKCAYICKLWPQILVSCTYTVRCAFCFVLLLCDFQPPLIFHSHFGTF